MIADKAQFNKLSQAGLLGNFLRTWDTLQDMIMDDYRGWVTIRARQKQSPWFVAHVLASLAGDEFRKIILRGGPGQEEFYLQEIPDPYSKRVIQFEAMLGPQSPGQQAGVNMVYELDTDKPLRDIRDRGTWASGYASITVLRRHLNPTSFDTLQDLWVEHPSAIIEATEFSLPCGVFNKQLCIWEMRNY